MCSFHHKEHLLMFLFIAVGSVVQQNRAQPPGFWNGIGGGGNSAPRGWRGYEQLPFKAFILFWLLISFFCAVLIRLYGLLLFVTSGFLLQQRHRFYDVPKHHHRHPQHGSARLIDFSLLCFRKVSKCRFFLFLFLKIYPLLSQRSTTSWASASWAKAMSEETEASTSAPSWREELWLQTDALSLGICCCRCGGVSRAVIALMLQVSFRFRFTFFSFTLKSNSNDLSIYF